jgi:peptide/nickel transport system permease protein
MRNRGSATDTLRRLFRDPGSATGACIIVATLIASIFAPLLTPYDPIDQNLALIAQPPTVGHPLGMDGIGRDMLSRLLYGAGVTIGSSLAAVALAALAGVALGLLAGYLGGRLDDVLMRTADGLLAFPSIVIAIVLATFLGPSLESAIVAVAIATVPGYVRLTRGLVLGIREQEFVIAAQALGAGRLRIVVREVFPNALSGIVVYTSLEIGSTIVRLASLSFLGLGAQPPTPEWGAMLNSAQQWLFVAPHISLVPGIAIGVVVVAFNLVGDGLRDALDPELSPG